MIRAACRTGLQVCFVGLLWSVAIAAQAAPLAALRVRPLHAAGGEGGVERELPARLTTAMGKFLRDHADPALRIETAERAELSAGRAGVSRYTLEGDLSYASGPDAESGRYLLVARLTREGMPSALIGQWAGSASSLRYLTANLRSDPRVHTLGLIGEIGSRVLTAVAADAATPDRQWRALVSRLPAMRIPKVMIIQAEPPYSVRPEIAGGAAFRLRLPAAQGLPCYLLTSGAESTLEALPLTPTTQKAVSAHAAPTESQVVRLPEGTREAWMVCRNVPAAHAATVRTYKPHGRSCRGSADEDDAPVHVVNGVGKAVTVQKEILTSLLAEIAREPQGWLVMRLRVTITRK